MDDQKLIRVWNLDVDKLFGDLLEEKSPKDIPPVEFTDVNRWRKLSPLKAARAWGHHASELAERAEWEAGVARQAISRGEMLLAIDALDRATRRVNGARFLEALMANAIASWCAVSEDRQASPVLQQQVLRTRTAIEVADRTLKDLRAAADQIAAARLSDSDTGAA